MADPNSSLTPEQKLLQMIEQPAGTPSAPGDTSEKSKDGPKPSLASLLSPSALKGRIAYAKDKVISFVKDRKEPINFRQVNQVAKMVALVIGLYLMGAIVYEVTVVYQNLDKEFATSTKEMADLPQAQIRKIDPNLFEDVQNRNIFMPQEKRGTGETVENQSESLKLVDITKDLKLTGISIHPTEPTRTFCMVEDLKKNVTSFLRVGDSISGLRVDQISSNGIVLKHQKDSIELR